MANSTGSTLTAGDAATGVLDNRIVQQTRIRRQVGASAAHCTDEVVCEMRTTR